MKKNRLTQLIVATVALAMAIPVFAFDLPRGARLSVHDDSGNLIGRGHVDGDEVELDLRNGAAGFATLEVELAGGETVVYEVWFNAEGGLLVVDGAELIERRQFVRDEGLEFDFDYDDDFDLRGDDDLDDDDDDRDDDDRDD